jgi:hypothetical protein
LGYLCPWKLRILIVANIRCFDTWNATLMENTKQKTWTEVKKSKFKQVYITQGYAVS